MRRIRIAVILAAITSLVIAGTAAAARITGGTTTITPSSTASLLLSSNHITITPIAPATAANGAISFPITRGHINPTTLHGVVRHSGGLQLSNGTRTVLMSHPVIVSDARGAYVWALIRDHSTRVCYSRRHHPRRRVCVAITRYRETRILQVSGGSVSNGTYTGTVTITAPTAHVVNRLAGSHIVSAGEPFGTISVAASAS